MANTSESLINVVLLGTNVLLPDLQEVSAGFVVGGGGTNLTVLDAGVYQITYTIRTTLSLALGSRVTNNDVTIPASVIAPILGTTYHLNFIASLPANSVLELELFGLLGLAVLAGGVGANLQVIRIA
jgi:hypothetical protein